VWSFGLSVRERGEGCGRGGKNGSRRGACATPARERPFARVLFCCTRAFGDWMSERGGFEVATCGSCCCFLRFGGEAGARSGGRRLHVTQTDPAGGTVDRRGRSAAFEVAADRTRLNSGGPLPLPGFVEHPKNTALRGWKQVHRALKRGSLEKCSFCAGYAGCAGQRCWGLIGIEGGSSWGGV